MTDAFAKAVRQDEERGHDKRAEFQLRMTSSKERKNFIFNQ
jgi:hypothetical protein